MVTQPERPSARDRLLDAADALFFRRGIAVSGVDDVLREAEVSVATLYAQFGSKDGLIEASLRRRLDVWQAIWHETVEAAATDQDRLLAVFDALMLFRQRHTSARWCAFLSTASELPDAGHPARALIEADTALLLDRLEQLAQPLAGPDARALAEQILLVYNGTLTAFLRGQPEDPARIGKQLASAAIEGIEGYGPTGS